MKKPLLWDTISLIVFFAFLLVYLLVSMPIVRDTINEGYSVGKSVFIVYFSVIMACLIWVLVVWFVRRVVYSIIEKKQNKNKVNKKRKKAKKKKG